MKRTTAAWTLGLALALGPAPAMGQDILEDRAFLLYRRAVAALDRKEFEQAERLAREAVAEYPDHVLAYYALAQAAVGQSKWTDAVTALDQVTRLYPRSFAGHRSLGIALEQLGRLDEAARAYEAARALQPKAEDIEVRLAFVYLRAKRDDRALPVLTALAERGSRDPDVWVALARLLYERADLAGSEEAFQQALALRDDPRTAFNLGVVRLRRGDRPGALKAFERAARDPALREQAMREIERAGSTSSGGNGSKSPARRTSKTSWTSRPGSSSGRGSAPPTRASSPSEAPASGTTSTCAASIS
jgi:tetratricopeptide (TPR) repeat protein